MLGYLSPFQVSISIDFSMNCKLCDYGMTLKVFAIRYADANPTLEFFRQDNVTIPAMLPLVIHDDVASSPRVIRNGSSRRRL